MPYLYKPEGENSGRPVVILPREHTGQVQSIQYLDSNGNVIGSPRFRSVLESGTYGGGGIYDLPNGNGSAIRYTTNSGQTYTYPTGGGQRIDNGQLISGGSGAQQQGTNGISDLVTGAPGSNTTIGETGGGPGGAITGPGGTPVSGNVAFPIAPGPFPSFPNVSFPTVPTPQINQADYKFTDTIKFGEGFADANRKQLNTNFAQARGFASQALESELEGLKAFVPAAAALSREQTSIDNQANQAARTAQVEATLPGARGTFARNTATLLNQEGRAESYAAGRLPDDVLDRALELGTRSNAADIAGFSGIGPRSRASGKISDLMSADQRFQIAQYGEQLTGQNIQAQQGTVANEASLFLAPTSYSQTGQQVRVTPEVGAGRLTYQGLGAINEATLVSPGQALSTEVQQQQFTTQLQQRTNEYNAQLQSVTDQFNANGLYNAATFNAQGNFQSAIGQFSSTVAFNNAVTGATQQLLNTALGLGIQGVQNDSFAAGQDISSITSIGQAIGAAAGAVGGTTATLGTSSSDTSSVPTGTSTGKTQVDTSASPSPTISQPSSAPQSSTAGTIGASAPTVSSASPAGRDSSSPGAYQFAAGTPTPSGYTAVANNPNGTYSAVNNDDYKDDLDRFARSNNYSGPMSVQSAATVDRAISTAAALSYVPIGGFNQIALTSSGKSVYSLPAASQSGDTSIGRRSLVNAGIMASYLGVDDPGTYSAIGRVAGAAGDASFQSQLDQIYADKGEDGVAQEIVSRLADKKLDLNTDAGQQLAFGAQRIAELWPNLSPGQRSLAISALGTAAIEHETGQKVGDREIPGTNKSPLSSLKVADVIGVSSRGHNGEALARNWNQLSALGRLVSKDARPGDVAALSDSLGILGHGPEGAAVKVDAKYLQQVGAKPAPHLGVGAMVFDRANHVPANYKVVTQTPNGGVIALPANLASTSSLGGSPATAFKQAQSIATKSHPAQKLWGASSTGRVVRGAVGGSAIVAGMEPMLEKNPYLASGMIAYSLTNNTRGA